MPLSVREIVQAFIGATVMNGLMIIIIKYLLSVLQYSVIHIFVQSRQSAKRDRCFTKIVELNNTYSTC